MMQLNDRENLILKTTIEDFISSGLPISSQKLYKHYFHSISPATIRNTLAGLEKKGLYQILGVDGIVARVSKNKEE